MLMKRSKNVNLARLAMNVPRQTGAYGIGCNHVVYDSISWKVLFFSRIAGVTHCRKWSETNIWDAWHVFYHTWGAGGGGG